MTKNGSCATTTHGQTRMSRRNISSWVAPGQDFENAFLLHEVFKKSNKTLNDAKRKIGRLHSVDALPLPLNDIGWRTRNTRPRAITQEILGPNLVRHIKPPLFSTALARPPIRCADRSSCYISCDILWYIFSPRGSGSIDIDHSHAS